MTIGKPYTVERYTVYGTDIEKREYGAEEKISEFLHEQTKEMFQLKQVIPFISNGNTEDMLFVSEYNPELIKTDIFFEKDDEEYCDDQYLTSSQISMLKEIGSIEIDGFKYEIKSVSIIWSTENIGLTATIETKPCK